MKKNKKGYHHTKKRQSDHPLIGKRFVGILDVTKSGKGYVMIEGMSQDILIYPENMPVAFEGDRVEVSIEKVSKNGRPEGKVKKVLTHVRDEFIGRLEVSDKFAFLVPDSANIHTDIFVPLHLLKGAKNGDRAAVKVVEWQGKSKNPMGEVMEILTGLRENDIAMKEILTSKGFGLKFSKEAIKAAEQLSGAVTESALKQRKDLRALPTCTIDPKDAKDFDDALSVRALENELIEVGVHIADVSHYVLPGSILDTEAYERATSVYLPDRVAPMLPEQISNVLCSLRPGEDKYAFSVVFQMDRKGNVHHFWIGRTIIRSDQRFAYEEVQQTIETGMGAWKEELLLLNEIAQSLRSRRFEKGAINFSSEEVRFELNKEGVPVGLVIKQSKEANQLIEEFMLLANKQVAAFVTHKNKGKKPTPFPYRVHDLPNEEKLETFAAFASRFGYTFNLNSPKTIARSFNNMLRDAKGKPEQMLLEQLGIRTMAKAVYTTDNIGHYGLGFEEYCHFTSPIRRYPDILVHRILQQVLDKEAVSGAGLEEQCQHCSQQERKAMEAEREANKYKQVEYMQGFIGETLDAVITGVSPTGFWAETLEQKCEGMVSLTDLLDVDNFDYQEATFSLQGRHTGLRFQMGDKIKVKVAATHLEKRQIDFTLALKKERQPKK